MGDTPPGERQGRDAELSAGMCSPPGEMASQLAAGNDSRRGNDTGQDGDELKTQTDRDGQYQEALWALCAKSIFCARRAPPHHHPSRLRAKF